MSADPPHRQRDATADAQRRSDVTLALDAVSRGETEAAEHLLPLVYDELRRLAAARMAKTPPGMTLQPTALVHEAYLRLVRTDDPGWEHRGHFFGAAARAMRDILVEQARRKAALKHGGDRARMDADADNLALDEPHPDLLALHDALEELERTHPRQAQLVLLRSFAGLTNEHAARVLGVSVATVERDWAFARSMLQRALAEEPEA
jgi:RNA polymerase sigma factor (TIGR02999 family)